MRIIINQSPSSQHTDAVTAVGWSLQGELFSCSDDCAIHRWNMNGESIGKVCDVEVPVCEFKWFPVINQTRASNAATRFVVACTDGKFRFINAVTGRIEKEVDAHRGAVVSLAWNWDGTGLLTGGEEGVVKSWSQSGMLRSTLANTGGQCVHSLAWGPENDQVLFTQGKELVVKPLQPGAKSLQWKAHDGIVLKVDWSPVTNLIVSGGEDCRYRVWDNYGRQMFTSPALDYPVTAVSFSPDGEMYAVGSFNMLRICDKTGWSHCRESTNTGSLFNIAWTADCTQLACAAGNGFVCFAQLVDRRWEYKNLAIRLTEPNMVQVHDVLQDSVEELEHRDKVINVSVGYGYLVVATSTQCCVYDVNNLRAPTIFDVKDAVNLICQAEKTFLLMDHTTGVQTFQYDGRPICTLKMSEVRAEFLNYQSVSLSPDTVAVRDTFNPKGVHVYESQTGKQITEISIQHTMEIIEISLNHFGPAIERKMAFMDRNRDLYICSVAKKSQSYKLATMVAAVRWNDTSDILAAIADGKLVVWYYPSVVFVDRDLLPRTRVVRDDAEFGRNDNITDFFGSRVTVRRGSDGAVLTYAIKPYPIMLFGHVGSNDWDAAVRLCRFVKEDALWAILAALSIKAGELSTAEVAYASMEESDKLQFIKYVQDIPSQEGKNAELALFQRKLDEAEGILLQGGLIYRAISMHVRLYNFDRALDLALQHKQHVDTVLWFRQKYLKTFHKEESNPKFLAPEVQQVGQDLKWETISALIEAEQKKEMERG